MAKPSTAQMEDQHAHLFLPGYKPEERYCKCGALQVSQQEYDRRTEEWNNYFELVRASKAYVRYQEIHTAWEEKNMKKVKELSLEAGQDLEVTEYMSKPNFPDPTTWNKYVTE